MSILVGDVIETRGVVRGLRSSAIACIICLCALEYNQHSMGHMARVTMVDTLLSFRSTNLYDRPAVSWLSGHPGYYYDHAVFNSVTHSESSSIVHLLSRPIVGSSVVLHSSIQSYSLTISGTPEIYDVLALFTVSSLILAGVEPFVKVPQLRRTCFMTSMRPRMNSIQSNGVSIYGNGF